MDPSNPKTNKAAEQSQLEQNATSNPFARFAKVMTVILTNITLVNFAAGTLLHCAYFKQAQHVYFHLKTK